MSLSSENRRIYAAFLMVMGVLTFAIAIPLWYTADPSFETTARQIQGLSIPHGGTMTGLTSFEHAGHSATVSWNIETLLSWPEFCTILKQRMPCQYQIGQEDEAAIEFRKKIGFDTLFLRIERNTKVSPNRFEAALTAHSS